MYQLGVVAARGLFLGQMMHRDVIISLHRMLLILKVCAHFSEVFRWLS
jgi:hypothetical protein